MQDVCTDWSVQSPKFEHVIVAAAVLEDPFAAGNVEDRIPTLIRRFVNRFKRSRRVTSFETLESTMTLHGALRLLDLPTQAGASLTLRTIRDAYKKKAIEAHPDERCKKPRIMCMPAEFCCRFHSMLRIQYV